MEPLNDDLEILRREAVAGDQQSLTRLVELVTGDIYRLAVRMVWDRSDSEDATQEILVKVVTKLDSFNGASSLKTWVYRIAVNHLLDFRRGASESLSFDLLAADLRDSLADPDPTHQPELEILANEVKVTCTGAMLLCLDRPHRVAYVLGEILAVPGPTAAEIVGISPASFRKRLSRARSDIRAFMTDNCGLISESAPCRCTRRVNRAIELNRIQQPGGGRSSQSRPREEVESAIDEIETLQTVSSVMRSTLNRPIPTDRLDGWRSAIDASTILMRNK